MTSPSEVLISTLICGFGVSVAVAYFVAQPRRANESLQWWMRLDGREAARRRWSRRNLGMGILTVIALTLLAGSALLDHVRSPAQFAYYWLAVLLLVVWMSILALTDIYHTLRVLRAWQDQDRVGTPDRYLDRTPPARPISRREGELP